LARSRDQAVIHDRAVFEVEARIAARVFALQALVNAKSCVNANVAVGVRADLPSGEMRFEAVRVQLLLGHHENAVVVRTAFIGDREARGALGNRILAKQSVFGSGVKVSVLTVVCDKVDSSISTFSGNVQGTAG